MRAVQTLPRLFRDTYEGMARDLERLVVACAVDASLFAEWFGERRVEGK